MQNAKCKAKMRLRRKKLHGICAFLQRKVAQNSSSVLCRKVLCCLATFRQRWNCNKIMFESIAQNAKCKTQSVGRKMRRIIIASQTRHFEFRISHSEFHRLHPATGIWRLAAKNKSTQPKWSGALHIKFKIKLIQECTSQLRHRGELQS